MESGGPLRPAGGALIMDDMARHDNREPSTRGDLWALEKRLDARLDSSDSVQKRIMVELARLVGSVDDLKAYMVKNMATKSEVRTLQSAVDSFAGGRAQRLQ
jgi:hypothetical protein